MDLGFTITGDRRVQIRFDQFPQELHEQLRKAVVAATAELEAAVRVAVPKRTGRLASEIVSRVSEGEDWISGRVTLSGEFAKAAALEYGAHKPTAVAAHMARLDHVFATQLATPLAVFVKAYKRTPDVTETRFLRGPLDALRPEIEAELTGAVEIATKAEP